MVDGVAAIGGGLELRSSLLWPDLVPSLQDSMVCRSPRDGFWFANPVLTEALFMDGRDGAILLLQAGDGITAPLLFIILENGGHIMVSGEEIPLHDWQSVSASLTCSDGGHNWFISQDYLFRPIAPCEDFSWLVMCNMWCAESELQLDNDQIDAHMNAHTTNSMGGVISAAFEDAIVYAGWAAHCSSCFKWMQLLPSGVCKVSYIFLLEFDSITSSCSTSTSNAMCQLYYLVNDMRYGMCLFSTMMVGILSVDVICKCQYLALLVRCCGATMVVARSSELRGLKMENKVFVPRFATIQKPKSVCHSKHLINGRTNFLIEQDLISVYCGTRFYLHGEDAVPVVRVDPPAVDDNTSVTIPQIQQQGLLSLSSVRDLRYLQLNTPLPQVHTPDRPLGEPPTGHQLVWSAEALGDCSCGTFGSELSADGRSPFGSYCSLQRLHYVLWSTCVWVVQPSMHVSCSAIKSHDVT